jgi:hypothetical protein
MSKENITIELTPDEFGILCSIMYFIHNPRNWKLNDKIQIYEYKDVLLIRKEPFEKTSLETIYNKFYK